MLSGRRYRLALTDEQAAMCTEFGHICRVVWNTALDQRRQYVDRGVAVAATTSTGEFHDRTFATGGEKTRHLKLQKKFSRQAKGSVNRARTLKAMGRISTRAVYRRGDFCAQLAYQLTTRHNVVALEDLRTTDMTASARGTLDAPGTQVRQKAGLNRAILDKGWHRLELALRNAARRSGTRIVLVNPAYISQTCYRCQEVDVRSRKSQAEFVCTACGYTDHADVNAAKNVCRAAGHAVPACGDLGVTRSVKQEPPGTREEVPDRPALELVGIPRL